MTPTEALALTAELRRIYQAIDAAECSRNWHNLSPARLMLRDLISQADEIIHPRAALVPAERMHARIVEIV